ncbi:MAG: matrixin family metalloprotease [Gammaproteobacteria bacterium]|nr:matrixin family metalloprotease [Pseudomonadales bacterium]
MRKLNYVSMAFVLAVSLNVSLNIQAGEASGRFWPGGTTTFYTDDLQGINDFWKETFEEAARRWNDVPTQFKISTVRESGSGFCESFGTNSAQTRPDSCGDEWGTGVLAVTQQWYYSDNSYAKADIVFNDKVNWSVYDGYVRPISTDFRRVAMHELGHAMGLTHSSDASALMYAFNNETFLPQQDDIDPLVAIYGSNSHLLTLKREGKGHIVVRPFVDGTSVKTFSTELISNSNYGEFLDCYETTCEIAIQDGLRLTIQAVGDDGESWIEWVGLSANTSTVDLAPLQEDLALTAVFGDPNSYEAPVVSIVGGKRTIPDSDGLPGESITLTATATDSDGSIESTEWLINSKVVATGLAVEIALPDGQTGITFRASDNDGAVSVTSTVIVVEAPGQPPIVNIIGGDRTLSDSDGFAGEIVSLSAEITETDSAITSIEWLVADQVVATDSSMSVFISDGITSVTIRIRDLDGDSATDSALVTVLPPPLEEGWPAPFSGVMPDPALELEFNNIGMFNFDDGLIYSCLRILADGEQSSFNGIEKYDIAFEVIDIEQAVIGIAKIKTFNRTEALNENGEYPDCSGSIEMTTGIYQDILQINNDVFRIEFELFDTLNVYLRVIRMEPLET